MKYKPSELLDVHAVIQCGTYFSNILVLDTGMKYAYSDSIEDFYWNYAYNLKESLSTDVILEVLKQAASSKKRYPALYLTSELDTDEIIRCCRPKEIEEEVWMILDKAPAPKKSVLQVETFVNRLPSAEFLRVFLDAYGGGQPDSPGYHGLPPEYVDAITNSSPLNNVQIIHFEGRFENEVVAIASIFMYKEYCGLYNVGTCHSSRRKGFGREISKQAVDYAFKEGAEMIFLQTKANSEVETMYKQLGFETKFTGMFLKF
ncbi:MAG: GNAT family N-acetyltransferase [Sediminibacterium sp.]